MEKEDQGMGLKENINNISLLATSAPNDIDVHMIKNTEYGAAILLGASDYGKQGTADPATRFMNQGSTTSSTDIQASTTGNVYGIYELGYTDMDITTTTNAYEGVAGGLFSSSSFDARYVDNYTTERLAKPGDATIETSQWHGQGDTTWVESRYPYFRRGHNSAFAYSYDYWNGGRRIILFSSNSGSRIWILMRYYFSPFYIGHKIRKVASPYVHFASQICTSQCNLTLLLQKNLVIFLKQ